MIEGFHGLPYTSRWAAPARSSTSSAAACAASRSPPTAIFNLPLPEDHGAVTGLGKPLKILTKPERDTIPI